MDTATCTEWMGELPSGILIPFLISRIEALRPSAGAWQPRNLPGPNGRFLRATPGLAVR